MLVCSQCPGRSFKNDIALQQHRVAGKHKGATLCPHCNQGLKSQKALQQHINDKHSMHNRNPTFAMGAGLPAHQNAKSQCGYCDRVFETKKARKEHQKTHRVACRHCNRKFKSEVGRSQHEASMHNFKCAFCHIIFSNANLLRLHEQYHLINCRYCAGGFSTHFSRNAHELSCAYNPATMVKRPVILDHPTFKSSSSSLDEHEMMETDGGSSTAVVVRDDVSDSPSSSLSNSSLDERETFHSTSGISLDAVGDEATIEEPCVRVRSHEPITYFGSEQTSSSNTSKPVPDNMDDAVCSDDNPQEYLADSRNVIFRCAACLDFFAEDAYQDHICPYRTAMFKPHCPVCYSQFEDESLLQRHLEDSEAFSCQLCQTQCCSEEMKEDHLLSHPTCPKCGESFADNLALCEHLESDHPVVVCWDCDGIVVGRECLELHYAESPAHPSCVICGVGTRNSDAMDEHVRHLHSSVAAMPKHSGGGDANASLDEEPSLTEIETLTEDQNAAGLPSDQPVIEPIVPLGGPCDDTPNSPSRTESSLFLSPQSCVPAQVEHISEPAADACVINEEEPLDRMDVDARHYAPPSPTPSEHGSDVSCVPVHAIGVTNTTINNDSRASSPVLTVSADSSFSDTGRTTSSHSVVFVSADGIPEYIRENRAVLVATSAGSPSSDRTPLRLPSTSSLESLDMVERIRRVQAQSEERSGSVESAARPTHRLHCRICLKDPCEEMTATICGHVFCKRCITQAVVAKSECPVCKSATLLYCLFKLDLSV